MQELSEKKWRTDGMIYTLDNCQEQFARLVQEATASSLPVQMDTSAAGTNPVLQNPMVQHIRTRRIVEIEAQVMRCDAAIARCEQDIGRVQSGELDCVIITALPGPAAGGSGAGVKRKREDDNQDVPQLVSAVGRGKGLPPSTPAPVPTRPSTPPAPAPQPMTPEELSQGLNAAVKALVDHPDR